MYFIIRGFDRETFETDPQQVIHVAYKNAFDAFVTATRKASVRNKPDGYTFYLQQVGFYLPNKSGNMIDLYTWNWELDPHSDKDQYYCNLGIALPPYPLKGKVFDHIDTEQWGYYYNMGLDERTHAWRFECPQALKMNYITSNTKVYATRRKHKGGVTPTKHYGMTTKQKKMYKKPFYDNDLKVTFPKGKVPRTCIYLCNDYQATPNYNNRLWMGLRMSISFIIKELLVENAARLTAPIPNVVFKIIFDVPELYEDNMKYKINDPQNEHVTNLF